MLAFVRWYNTRHQHSAIRFVIPDQRHRGEDKALLASRHAVYQAAREQHPARWSGQTRNWHPIGPVWLNPERPETRRGGHGGAAASFVGERVGAPMADPEQRAE